MVAEHVRRRPREVDDRAARPGLAADRARVVAGPHERVRLGARRAGRRLPRQQRGPAAQQSGALGEPGRLLAQHDRHRDRRPDLRRRHRAQERRAGQGGRVRDARRRLAAARRELDRDHERPVLAPAVLPARDQGRDAGQPHDLQPGRQLRPPGRPARDRRQLVPRPRPVRRQAVERPDGAQLADRRRQHERLSAGGRDPERDRLAPLHLRRLRRAARRRRLGPVLRQPDAPDARAPVAAAEPASAASTSCSRAANRAAICARSPTRPTTG